jgi:hypothetical protein
MDTNGYTYNAEKRMYVFVRKDIPFVHQAVQAGHAVAQYIIDNKGKLDGWSNGTLIYLAVNTETELLWLKNRFNFSGRVFSCFYEPDWGEADELTAIATIAWSNEFYDYKTIKMDCFITKIAKKIKRRLLWIKRALMMKSDQT